MPTKNILIRRQGLFRLNDANSDMLFSWEILRNRKTDWEIRVFGRKEKNQEINKDAFKITLRFCISL